MKTIHEFHQNEIPYLWREDMMAFGFVLKELHSRGLSADPISEELCDGLIVIFPYF